MPILLNKKILEIVEEKIKEHGDIIDKKTKNQVERIRKLFDSEQFKNMTLSFGNNNSPSIGGKIIQDCKIIRAINKEIDKLIREKQKQEKQRKREQENKEEQEKQKQNKESNNLTNEESKLLSNLVSNHPEIKNEQNPKKRIHKLLLKYHPNKTFNLPENEKLKRNEISKKLVDILHKL
jgi:hypothetical protein